MSVLLSLVPSLIGTGVGIAQQSKLRKDLAERQQAAEGQFDRSLQAIRDISFEPSQQLRDARMSQLEAGRAIGDLAAQRTDEAQARAIAALRDSPRALQSAGTRVIDSALAAQQQADIAGTQQTLGAELGMAEDAEQTRMQALQRDLSLEQMLMNRAAQAGDVAQSGIFASQAATTEGLMAMGNALTQGLLQQGDFLNRNTAGDNTDTQNVGDLLGRLDAVDVPPTFSPSSTYEGVGPLSGQMPDPFGTPVVTTPTLNIPPVTGPVGNVDANPAGFQFFGPELLGNVQPRPLSGQSSLDIFRALPASQSGFNIDFGRPQVGSFSAAPFVVREEGGYIGEEGGVTEGEFNHDTNKKAIIDEENGQKEGELTGGEMVLNPEQTDGITTLVEKGDAEGLLMFLRDLLSQPQFQEA
tara:strand:+ start:16072 stop:17307 length:1236 start_codon:yes stop_codon:yes gene_type:complete